MNQRSQLDEDLLRRTDRLIANLTGYIAAREETTPHPYPSRAPADLETLTRAALREAGELRTSYAFRFASLVLALVDDFRARGIQSPRATDGLLQHPTHPQDLRDVIAMLRYLSGRLRG